MGNETTESYDMKSGQRHTRGFTLIASLLMLLVLSGLAIGLMMMVTTESKVGGTDLQNNVAFHSAEGGIEKMASDLNSVFKNAQAPLPSQICGVGSTANQPVMVGVTWTQYSVQPGTTQTGTCPTTLTATWGQITAGPDQGLWAQIIPVNMLATAAMPGGQEVTLTRNAQVALIPVFQFGVFSESDLSFFSGPNFSVIGPVHTNSDLYPFVGNGSTLTFTNKVEAYGNVVRTQLANGWPATTNYNGTVDVPTTANGCSTPTTNCVAMVGPGTTSPYGDGSVTGAGSPTAQTGTYNTNPWNTFSNSSTHLLLINGNYGSASKPGTGAKNLKMPFVTGTTFPFQIVRRPTTSDSQSLTQSREYNLAQIHVLLIDTSAELPAGSVRLANVTTAQATATGGTATNPYGVALTASSVAPGLGLPALTGTTTYNLYFAAASNGFPDETPCGGTYCPAASTDSSLGQDWPYAPTAPPAAAVTLSPTSAPVMSGTSATAPPTINLCTPAAVATPPAGCPTTAPAYPYYSVGGVQVTNNATAIAAGTATWNLIDGYLYVEYKDASGTWHNVTNEWLQLGFARGPYPPSQSGAGTPATGTPTPAPNPINPNAILLLQEASDRNGSGSMPDSLGLAPVCTHINSSGVCTTWKNPLPPEVQPDTTSTSPYFGVSTEVAQSISMYNWYPINFYDVREGEVRDNTVGNNSCTTMGVMNAVEIDVGNLKQWLLGNIGTSGSSVDYVAQNGYVLYFSDRRGMLPNPNAVLPNAANTKSGDSGLEDVVNAANAAGTPDGVLEPTPAGRSLSPEDVNQNGVLDNFGAANLGLGQYNGTVNQNTQINLGSLATPNPFLPRINNCATTGRKSWVSGARHVLRLVDGSLGNVPLVPGGTLADPGGFSVASENPVYILGDYNSNPGDTTWTTGVDVLGHSSASVIADAATFLSSNWSDLASLGVTGSGQVTDLGNRSANTDYYRVAVAGGKNINFPQPTWGASQDFGTDGGVHNFLRYLENWGGQGFNYKGSIVSLYYSTYATGVFKCCTVVYSPPTRNDVFDLDFTSPQGLPPGTPMFRDLESLGYRQLFTARQTGQ
jgi:Tfp pilus assembly protein PilX